MAVQLLVIGVLVGGFIGFLQRPSALLVGQLPFSTVITRGANLQGLDQLLIPLAQRSFNVMVTWSLVGGAAGAMLQLSREPSRPAQTAFRGGRE